MATVRHLSTKAPVIAWRQGHYGLAAVAAGAIGYQTGMAVDERCDFAQHARVRRPQPPDKKKDLKMPRHVYLSLFGRSVSGSVAESLINNGHLRGTLTCTDPACCTNGASSMSAEWRQHAVRARARELAELDDMPNAGWRLNHVARLAERAADAPARRTRF
ncbi:hypothetical protein H7H73_32520 [Mycobacterium rufum]|uniref:Uncharacterized protein n=1 Tax=Mycolicibacterium rufum TaxID=318424 RepID=A0A9X3BS65_9MYCO|nr:hypothetical protein [Mycolicibacterium rufum]